MKTNMDFINLVMVYADHQFPNQSNVKIEHEELEELVVVKCHYADHLMELQYSSNGLTTIFKFENTNNRKVCLVKNLENSYKRRTINNSIYLGSKTDKLNESDLPYELEKLFNDFETLIKFFDKGIIELPRYLELCITFSDAIERANQISSQSFRAKEHIANYFKKMGEEEFENQPLGTLFVFNANGVHTANTQIIPTSATVIRKTEELGSIEKITNYLQKEYDLKLWGMDSILQDLHKMDKRKNYLNNQLFNDLDYEEAVAHCQTYGDQAMYLGISSRVNNVL